MNKHMQLFPVLVAAANLDVMGGSNGGRLLAMDVLAGKKAVQLLQLHMGGFARLRGAAWCLVARCSPSASCVLHRF